MARIEKDVVIVGAGAAGLMCAVEASRRGRSVAILDHAGSVAGKVRVSGGGHCNFTNLNAGFEHYISGNPHFCRSALARFTPADFISMLESRGIRYYEKKSGQMFCHGGAMEIVEMLLELCRAGSVAIVLDCGDIEIEKGDTFLTSTAGVEYASHSVVIATGGLPMPRLGATGLGYEVARRFGLRVTPLRPALTPFRFTKEDLERFGSLSGVSLDAVVVCGGRSFHESILFTHRGLSGPAILQASSYWKDGEPVTVNLLPGIDLLGVWKGKTGEKMHLGTFLSRFLPRRFALKWCELFAESYPLRRYSPKELAAVEAGLHGWVFVPACVEGFDKAEVTLGGVDTKEVSSKTMEAGKVPGLYFVGEVLDVTGHLGGFNLQWAWSSGFTAGQYA